MKSLFLKVILPLFGIAAILGFITILQPVKPIIADWEYNNPAPIQCGPDLKVILVPVNQGDCSNNKFQSEVKVMAENDNAFHSTGAYTVHWRWSAYWCPDNGGDKSNAHCYTWVADNNPTDHTQMGLTGINSAIVDAFSPEIGAQAPYTGQVCGHFQSDFAFYVTTNDNYNNVLCGISGAAFDRPGMINENEAATCNTNVTCTLPTPTPIPTNTPVPTATPIPTNTPTPTSTPMPTPTSTPSPTPTHAPTPTPTTTTGCGGTQTGFNNNSNCQNQNQNQDQSQLQLQGQSQYQINGNNTLDNSSNNSSTNNSTNSNSINIQLDRINADPFEFVA